jgi:ribonuclease III
MKSNTVAPGFEKKIGYVFNDPRLLEEALRHRSFVNEQPQDGIRDNERLEFLGDAVLNLSIGHLLMEYHPESKEGDLSRIRASLVNETCLASIARDIELGPYIHLGKGEQQSQGSDKNSILADTLEAIIAAVYLDGGFEIAFSIIKQLFDSLLTSHFSHSNVTDYKSQLQELVQTTHKTTPHYQIVKEIGPDHDKTFICSVTIADTIAEGTGKSKKTAQQDAAHKAYDILVQKSMTSTT